MDELIEKILTFGDFWDYQHEEIFFKFDMHDEAIILGQDEYEEKFQSLLLDIFVLARKLKESKMLKEGVREKFLTNTDETGRFVIYSPRTGRSYYIEPIGDSHIKWGSVDPSSKGLMVKKGWKKHTGSISEDESLIIKENGFENIRMLEPGVSPLKAIEYIDDQYPDSN